MLNSYPTTHFLESNGYQWLIWRVDGSWLVRHTAHEVAAAISKDNPGYVMSVANFLEAGVLKDIKFNSDDLVLTFKSNRAIILKRQQQWA